MSLGRSSRVPCRCGGLHSNAAAAVRPQAEEVLEKRKKFMHPSIFHYYKKPLMVVEGKMQYVWDERGRRYLDCFGGIVTVSVGHCHPEVVKACEDQSRLLQHATTIYLHPEVALYAEELAERMPKGLDCVYFVNSGAGVRGGMKVGGSEANDLAMLMARLHTAASARPRPRPPPTAPPRPALPPLHRVRFLRSRHLDPARPLPRPRPLPGARAPQRPP
eukprot:tig00000806_g4376.t1